MNATAVAIVDQHPLMRDGMRIMLRESENVSFEWEAASVAEARTKISGAPPDVVILDIALPDGSGIEFARDIRDLACGTRVLVLTAHDEPPFVAAALAAGVSGYMLKSASAEALLSAISAIMSGEFVLQQEAANPATQRFMSANRATNPLSAREMDVVRLAGQGQSNKMIAQKLDVSVRTVETHFSNVLRKLDVSSRTEAVVLAASRAWLTLSHP